MADTQWGGIDDIDEEDEEESAYEPFQSGRDSIVFLIDCTKPMFVKREDAEECPFQLTIKCCINTMKNKIVSSERDLLGVIFFGTDKSKNPSEFKNIYVYQELDQPGAENILALEKLYKGSKEDFKKDFGHSETYSLSDALWVCSAIFAKCSVKLANRRILLFTNEDHPHQSSAHLQRQAIEKARDLYENGIELDLMSLNKPGSTFKPNLFYKDVINLPDNEAYGQQFPDASDKFEELLTRVRSKDHKKRTLGTVMLELPGDVKISVGVYNLVRSVLKPSPIRLALETNEELQTMSKTFLAETGEIVLPGEIRQYKEYGGEKIFFDADEVREIKQFVKPGITLLGFKPASAIKPYYHVAPASFIYPNDAQVAGSTTLFAALLQRCLERQVVAVAFSTLRSASAPYFVVLMPQKEELNDNNVQVTPPGFHIIPMPYDEDIRELVLGPIEEKASEEQIEKAKEIIKKVKCQFKSENFENPVLQMHWRNIEALALDLDEPDPMTDYTLPVTDVIEKRAGKLIADFQALVFSEGFDPDNTTKKRPLKASNDRGAKKSKPNTDDVSVDVIEAEVLSGQLSKLTVLELKKRCQKLGYTILGKLKEELLEHIQTHFGHDGGTIKLDADHFSAIEAEVQNGQITKLTVPELKRRCQDLGYTTTGKKKAELIEHIQSHFAS